MGQTTLSEFRTRLQTTLGNRGLTNAELDIWINAGYFEVIGAVKFDDMKLDLLLFTGGADVRSIQIPDRILAITSVHIDAESYDLIETSPENLKRRQREGRETGVPQYYAKQARNLLIYPVSDADYRLDGTAIYEPEKMDSDTDTTEIASTWDTAVHMFAASQAFLDLGEDERSAYWKDRAMMYAGSRITDVEYRESSVTEPVRVVNRRSDLTRMRGKR